MNIGESCKCPACSDSLVFDFREWRLCCPGCGGAYDIEKYERALRMKRRPPRDAEPDSQDTACPHCGAVLSPGIQAFAMTCPCCGGFYQDETGSKADCMADSIAGAAPDLVIPFAHGREVFLKAFREYCDTHPSLPDDLRRSLPPESIRPAYLPVIVYEALAAGDLSAEVRSKRTILGCRAGHFSLNLKGFPEPLSDLPLKDPCGRDEPGSLCLEPWEISRARPCRAAWFCGLRDKFGHTAPAEILKPQKSPNYEGIKKRIQDLCLRLIAGDKHVSIASRNLTVTPRNVRYVLFPVWLLSISYHGKTYLSVMNASTGKTTVSAPRSLLKNALVAIGFSSFSSGLFALVQIPHIVPLASKQHASLTMILFIALYLPALALIYTICVKSYQFCRRHLLKSLPAALMTSAAFCSAGLLMISAFSVLTAPVDRPMTTDWFVWVLLPFLVSLILFSENDDFVSYELDGKASDSILYPDRTDFDKRYIDLPQSSVTAEFRRRGKTERLPDPLASLNPADSG